MSILKEFQHYILKNHLFQQKDRLVLAVSGGIDSTVLCELCHQSGYTFEIAHCNFQLRGEESNRDEQFVRDLARKYEVEIIVKKFNTQEFADEQKLSIQVAARELRYEWFQELLKATPEPQHALLLTAHHANDNIETLLMNFFKGTGITGLRGILPKQSSVIRPLLFATKEDILQFARENNLDFVEDSSNVSDKYTRNFFRNQLIPEIQKVFPKVMDNLGNNLERFREIEMLYRQAIQFHTDKILVIKDKEIHIPVLKLLKITPLKTVVYEIIKEYDFTAHQTDAVIGLLKSESGKFISSFSHKIFKNRNWLIIAPLSTEDAAHILIEPADTNIKFELGELQLSTYNAAELHLSTSASKVQLNADEIQFPLLLRKWKQGDYFYPLGMNKKKKLSKFFIDLKLSITQKESIWVIESNQRIIWIVGQRIDNRFKIIPNTKKVLELSLK